MPDYRGVFLRGLGSVNSAHYGNVTHQSGAFGELQGDAIRNITGCMGSDTTQSEENNEPITSADNPPNFIGAFRMGPTKSYPTWSGNVTVLGNYAPQYIDFDSSRVVPTANEVRPINRAVRYFIRAA